MTDNIKVVLGSSTQDDGVYKLEIHQSAEEFQQVLGEQKIASGKERI